MVTQDLQVEGIMFLSQDAKGLPILPGSSLEWRQEWPGRCCPPQQYCQRCFHHWLPFGQVGNISTFFYRHHQQIAQGFQHLALCQAILLLNKFFLGNGNGARQIILGSERGCLSNSGFGQTSNPRSRPYLILNPSHLSLIILRGSINTLIITLITSILQIRLCSLELRQSLVKTILGVLQLCS